MPVPTPKLTQAECARRKRVIEDCLREGYAPLDYPLVGTRGSAVIDAARRLGISPGTLYNQVKRNAVRPNWKLFIPLKPSAAPVPAAVPEPVPERAERVEMTRLRDQVSSLQTQLRDADREHLDEKEVRERIFKLAAYEPSPPKWLIETHKNPSGVAGVPSTIWSDWHCGEVVTLAETNGVNEFNFAIAERRIKKLVTNTLDLCFHHMTGATYPGIVVNLGGDMISGSLHPELEQTDEDDIFPTILWTVDRLIWGLEQLADRFELVYVPGVPGNHGRVFDKKPHNKRYAYRNADWLIYKLLERHFQKDGRVTFDIPPTGEALYRVYGHRYMLVHGDDLGVRGGDGIIGAIGPIMRGEIKMRTSSAQIGRDYDTLLMGHWHQDLILPRAIVNPCLKGYDEYARRTLRAVPNDPAQMLWFTHPKYGITAYWKVQLTEATRSTEQRWLTIPEAR
jgi:transposase-like protein